MKQIVIAAAIEALSWIEYKGLNERSAIIQVKRQLDIREPEILQQAYKLMIETLRFRNTVDWILESVVPPDRFRELDLGTRNLLRLYGYLGSIKRAGVSQCKTVIESGRELLGWERIHSIEQAFGQLVDPRWREKAAFKTETERLAVLYSHPEWFVESCLKEFGRQVTLQLMRGNLQKPAVYVVLNSLRGNPESILTKLEREGVKLQSSRWKDTCYKVLRSKRPLVQLQSYKNGFFAIMDLASFLAAEAVEAKAHDTVVDICAAPGNKTAVIAQKMNNLGMIYSVDLSLRRILVWKMEISRLNVKCAEPIVADLSRETPLSLKADTVLVDPPCSNTGLYRRTPSVKWSVNPSTVRRLIALQEAILARSAELVQRGGSLVYSTCSVLAEEDELVIERFLRKHDDFRLVPLNLEAGKPGLRGLDHCRRFYPHTDESNGHFIAKMLREI